MKIRGTFLANFVDQPTCCYNKMTNGMSFFVCLSLCMLWFGSSTLKLHLLYIINNKDMHIHIYNCLMYFTNCLENNVLNYYIVDSWMSKLILFSPYLMFHLKYNVYLDTI